MTNKLYKHPFTVSNATRDTNGHIIAIHRSMKDVALSKTNDQLEQAVQHVSEYESRALNSLNLIHEHFLGDKPLVNNANELFRNWKPIRDRVIELRRSGEYEKAAEITRGEGEKHVVKIEKSMQALLDFANNKSFSAVYKDEQHLLQGYGSGAVDYIEKPINETILLSKVKIFLKLHQQKQQLSELLEKEKEQNLLLKKVSERIEAEHQAHNLSQVVEQSPTAVVITNEKAEIQYINTQFETMTDYTLDEIQGKNPSLLKSGNTPKMIYQEMWNHILSGQIWRGEMNNYTKTGKSFWVYATISAIHNSKNEITH